MKVTGEGHVYVTMANFFVTLAPYFVPLYAVLVFALFALGRMFGGGTPRGFGEFFIGRWAWRIRFMCF